MNKIIKEILNKAFKKKEDILYLIPGEQGNLAMVFPILITTKISKKANKRIKEVKK